MTITGLLIGGVVFAVLQARQRATPAPATSAPTDTATSASSTTDTAASERAESGVEAATGTTTDSSSTTIITGDVDAADLTGETLADNVIASSLTSVGTLETLTIASGLTVSGGSVRLPAASIQSAALASASVTSAIIVDSTVATGDLADDAVTAAKLDVVAINTAGLIPALSSAYLADLSGSALTGVVAASVPAASLTGTTIATNVTASSLTSVGTLSTLAVSGAATLQASATVGTGLTVTSGGATVGGNLSTSGYLTFTGTDSGDPGANRGLRNTNASGTVYDWMRAVNVSGVTKTRMNTDGSWEWYYGSHDMSNPSGPLVVHFAGHGSVEVFPQTATNSGFNVQPADDDTPAKDALNIKNSAGTQSNWYVSRSGVMYGKLNSGSNAQTLWLDNSDNILDVGASSALSGISLLPGAAETMRLTSGGLVGIGAVPTDAKLEITNADSASNHNAIEVTNSEPSGVALVIRQDTTTAGNANFLITNAAGTSTLLRADNAGRLGIGRAVSAEALEVQHMTTGTDTYAALFGARANSGLKLYGSTDGDVAHERVRFTAYRNDTTTSTAQLGIFVNNGSGMLETARFDAAGDLGIATCTDPDHDLTIGGSGTGCDTGTYSEIDAGEAQFTVSSSRALKQNFAVVSGAGILDRIRDVPVYTYDFKPEACTSGSCSDKIGLVAEDFHTIFGRGSNQNLSGQEVQMALWLGVQELTKQVAELTASLCALDPGAATCHQ